MNYQVILNLNLLIETKYSRHEHDGYSMDSCFLLKQGIQKNKTTKKNKIVTKNEFQNEKIKF